MGKVVSKTTVEERTKAVEELRLRQAAGAPITGIGEKYGVSDPTVYAWAKNGVVHKKPGTKPGGNNANKTPPEKRNALLRAWRSRKEGVTLNAFCTKHKVTRGTMKRWLAEPQEETDMPEAAEVAASPVLRQNYDVAFKQRVVEAYTTRKKGVTVDEVADSFGLPRAQIVHSWVHAMRNGQIPPISAGTQIVPAQASLPYTNGAHVELEQMSVSGLASMRLAQLEAQNKALRAIVKSLMENANQTDLKKINLLLLEQL